MVVVLANDIPPAVRGRLKLWFIEPKPNVFISGIKDSVADDVIEYLLTHCPSNSGLMIFKKTNEPPFYKIITLGYTLKRFTELTGMQLIIEKQEGNEN
ncbi:MAG: type I-E CRISPR-associated endoribonuclease Cas2e [Elusimicrobiales bacterium]|jgi:CRISPR-associated protein Cas2|nr:type I-E CRISPR-associated endoribonuclease Cas2e [Elusimicrobiales bacterium]HPO95029.1 type I-E CRISPR-associated endoribonuclease Cas2e [Elusimicrobiales bacterium]